MHPPAHPTHTHTHTHTLAPLPAPNPPGQLIIWNNPAPGEDLYWLIHTDVWCKTGSRLQEELPDPPEEPVGSHQRAAGEQGLGVGQARGGASAPSGPTQHRQPEPEPSPNGCRHRHCQRWHQGHQGEGESGRGIINNHNIRVPFLKWAPGACILYSS